MNEPEFIELLNLYLDHEISPTDAARLEQEVTTSEERRRVYHQYCLMHKGCSQLAGQFQEGTSDVRWTVRPPARSTAWSTGLFGAGVLAAACVAFLFVARMRNAPEAPALVGSAVAAATPVPSESFASALQPVVDMHSLTLNAVNAAPTAQPLEWLNRVQFAPISRVPINPILLKTSTGLPESDTRIATDAAAGQDQVENVSFKFQR
jgi:hypothetical protein